MYPMIKIEYIIGNRYLEIRCNFCDISEEENC